MDPDLAEQQAAAMEQANTDKDPNIEAAAADLRNEVRAIRAEEERKEAEEEAEARDKRNQEYREEEQE